MCSSDLGEALTIAHVTSAYTVEWDWGPLLARASRTPKRHAAAFPPPSGDSSPRSQTTMTAGDVSPIRRSGSATPACPLTAVSSAPSSPCQPESPGTDRNQATELRTQALQTDSAPHSVCGVIGCLSAAITAGKYRR